MSPEAETKPIIKTRQADYADNSDLENVVLLLNEYASDPMGGGKPLSREVLDRVKNDLKTFPGAFSILAFMNGSAVGVANCFTGYSTFKGAPLVNIHDIAVLPIVRGLGVGESLLKAIETESIQRGCCKITLEVREDNPAERLYRRFGFTDGEIPMRFLIKIISC